MVIFLDYLENIVRLEMVTQHTINVTLSWLKRCISAQSISLFCWENRELFGCYQILKTSGSANNFLIHKTTWKYSKEVKKKILHSSKCQYYSSLLRKKLSKKEGISDKLKLFPWEKPRENFLSSLAATISFCEVLHTSFPLSFLNSQPLSSVPPQFSSFSRRSGSRLVSCHDRQAHQKKNKFCIKLAAGLYPSLSTV